MKFILYILVLSVFYSCSAPKPEQSHDEMKLKFDSAWKADSSGKWKTTRTELAASSQRNEYSLYCRSWLLAQNGNLAKAIKTADSLVMGFPAFVKGYYLRANLRADAKDLEGAFGDFDKAIKRDPVFFEALMNRGSLHFSNQHPDLALKDFQLARKIQSTDPEVFTNLGNSWLALGKADSACKSWENAQTLGSKKAVDLLNRFCQQTGK